MFFLRFIPFYYLCSVEELFGVALTGRLAICLSLESGQFTAEGNMQERPRR